jgi:subfamily B ATP-binding cassette protein MsbA
MMRVVRAKAFSRSLIELMYIWGTGLLMLLGSYLAINGMWGLTWGRVIAFMAALAFAYKPAKTLVRAFNTVQESLAGCERVFHLLDIEPQIQDAPDAVTLDRIRKGIRFKGVWFAYDTEPVLKDINLEVQKGEIIAIVGRSGAGKSTLCDLILRFYDPTEGCIYIDDFDVRQISRESLFKHIAVVTQDPFLFNTTIKENIRYGKRDATDDEVVVAARAANIHDFIATLENGYDTVVGERGVTLSGGEKQRVTIARAIIKDAAILILDEATSSLDSESEQAVQTALGNLMAGKTTFVIAHRLSTVQHADKIVVLAGGKIAEIGTHSELLTRDGIYKRLYDMQFVENGGNTK